MLKPHLLGLGLLPLALLDGHLQSQVVASAQPLFLPMTEILSAAGSRDLRGQTHMRSGTICSLIIMF